jgi:hypothetical protein
MEKKTKYCPFCGNQIDYAYINCPVCGKLQPPIEPVFKPALKKKNVPLAVLLSLLITGLGQAYLGVWVRGLAFLVSAFSIVLFLGPYLTEEQMIAIGIIFGILSAVDAYFLAKKINQSAN